MQEIQHLVVMNDTHIKSYGM